MDIEYLVPSKQTTVYLFGSVKRLVFQGTQKGAECFSLIPVSWFVKLRRWIQSLWPIRTSSKKAITILTWPCEYFVIPARGNTKVSILFAKFNKLDFLGDVNEIHDETFFFPLLTIAVF